jgi:hypothetical protein
MESGPGWRCVEVGIQPRPLQERLYLLLSRAIELADPSFLHAAAAIDEEQGGRAGYAEGIKRRRDDLNAGRNRLMNILLGLALGLRQNGDEFDASGELFRQLLVERLTFTAEVALGGDSNDQRSGLRGELDARQIDGCAFERARRRHGNGKRVVANPLLLTEKDHEYDSGDNDGNVGDGFQTLHEELLCEMQAQPIDRVLEPVS